MNMKIYTTLQLGQFHTICCEDFWYYEQIHPNWLIAAVFDGCSSGKDSHFAASLFGKCLKMVCKRLPYVHLWNNSFDLNHIHPSDLGNFIQKEFFESIKQLYNQLQLDITELLSTSLLMVYQVKTRHAWINVSGDGLIIARDNLCLIEQNDRPNYLAYHLNNSANDWLTNQTITYTFSSVSDLSIATDGILSFAKNLKEEVKDIDPISYLLIDKIHEKQDNMLDFKCTLLKKNYQLVPNDDLSIIRVINANN